MFRAMSAASRESSPESGEPSPIEVDVAIVGAGIAGLWIGNLLTARGFTVAICDGEPIGGTQTIASQGIIHAGAKYALRRRAAIADQLAPMPERWRACLAGTGEVDLAGVRVLAPHVHLHAARSGAKARAVLTSFALGGATRVDASTPPFRGGALLRLPDFVIDVPSLVRQLAAPLRHGALTARIATQGVVPGPEGVAHIVIGGRQLRATIYVFAAGAGNGAFARRIGAANAATRLRPLRQTCARMRRPPPPVFAHCLAAAVGAAPELTVTSHGDVLYIGGGVANAGVDRSDGEQIDIVRALLADHLPALDLAGAEFATFVVERAESARRDGREAFVARHRNCLVCWPGKLSLAPRLGDLALRALADLEPRRPPWRAAVTGWRYATPPYASAAKLPATPTAAC